MEKLQEAETTPILANASNLEVKAPEKGSELAYGVNPYGQRRFGRQRSRRGMMGSRRGMMRGRRGMMRGRRGMMRGRRGMMVVV